MREIKSSRASLLAASASAGCERRYGTSALDEVDDCALKQPPKTRMLLAQAGERIVYIRALERDRARPL